MFEAALLGILQGLTEFLPISSSAHLIILPWFFGWHGTVDTLSFAVAVHFGTLIALLSYFRKDWLTLLRTANRKEGMIWHILIGTLPAVFVGFLFYDEIAGLRSPLLIVFTLCLVAVLMILVERSYKEPMRLGIDKLSRRDAFIIGIAQAFAFVPGVSRSGITIVAGLMLGFQRQASARFSFLLSMPVVAGASLLEAVKLSNSGGIESGIFLTGVITSAVTGYITVKYLLRFLQNHSLRVFAYYRFFIAFVIIIAIWTGLKG